MTGQDALAEAVLASKGFLTRYVAGFKDENCTKQSEHLPNHVVWCLGHCAMTMHRAAGHIDGQPIPNADFSKDDVGTGSKFHTESVAFGSAPSDDKTHYPFLARAVEIYSAACDRLAAAVRAADEATLNGTIKWRESELSLWALVMRVTFHNGMHGGQITDLRRALGLERVIK